MEPQYSILLFSKYSTSCRKLFDIMKDSRIDFSFLSTLCLDNPEVRKQIMTAKHFDINTVPCIICIFPTGGVETYEGVHAFAWIERMIPPPDIIKNVSESVRQDVPIQDLPIQDVPIQDIPIKDVDEPIPDPDRKQIHSHRQKEKPSRTPIDEIPSEDEQDERKEFIQRNKSSPPPRRIKKNNSGDYDEDEAFFSGEKPEIQQKKKVIKKGKVGPSDKDPHGTLSLSKQLALEREQMEENINPPRNRPLDSR
jgi:hypothetical protein